MSYTDKQKSQHINEAQRFLYSISYHNKNIPRIIPDGIFGSETAEAVKAFQDEYGLTSTGEIDYYTWDKLAEVYLEYNNDIVMLDVFPHQMSIEKGDSGAIVYIIQVILNTLSVRFSNIPKPEITGVYDDLTEEAVAAFKAIAGIENVSGIDSDTWNKLASAFNMMKKTV